MKRRLLFVIPNLSAGGGEKSLINLLSQFDYDSYEVDLFLLDHSGLFMELLPKQVRVLQLPETYRLFTKQILFSVLHLLVRGKFTLIANRLCYSLVHRFRRSVAVREQYNWKFLRRSIGKIAGSYDAAVGFLEKTSTYLCIDCVEAPIKLGWIHTDYDTLGMDPKFDVHYFEKLTKIITVSDECKNILQARFPNQRDKFEVIHNVMSSDLIKSMADQGPSDLFPEDRGIVKILSIGRLHQQKGHDLAVGACKILLDRGLRVKWYVIGEGDERESLEKKIKELGITEQFVLLGLQINPYPYIKQANIFAQTSRLEGKSIAIDEAKILSKPIVVTNFSTVRDQIVHGMNGVIVEMNEEAIADGIESLIRDAELYERVQSNLCDEKLGTEEETMKLYALLGG